MRHRTKNLRFRGGVDSNQMILRKLVFNFIRDSHMVTTKKKAMALKQLIETLISKSKVRITSNKNFILRYITDQKFINVLFDQVGPAMKAVTGGYVKTTKLNIRESDNADMMRVEWAHPLVIDWEKNKKSKKIETNDKTVPVKVKKETIKPSVKSVPKKVVSKKVK